MFNHRILLDSYLRHKEDMCRRGNTKLIDYGEDFWKIVSLHEDSTSSSSLWAASAPMPDSTPELTPIKNINLHENGDKELATPAPQQTVSWPDLVYAPADPAILGHSNTKHLTYPPTPIHFTSPLSPIKQHTSLNTNTYMNEIYSFTQLHDLDDTILLLPITITNT